MKERISYFDNAKAILIFLVVFGHLVDLICTSDSGHLLKWVFLCIWSFHMPAFLFLAGLMDHPRAVFPGKRVLRLILLGFILKLLNILVLVIYPEATADPSLFSDKNFPWFVFVLAAFTALAYLLQWGADRLCRDGRQTIFWAAVFSISFIVSLLAGYVDAIGDFLYLSRIIVFFPFYLAGYLMRSEDVAKCPRMPIVGILGLAITLFLFYFKIDLFYHLRPMFTGRNAYTEWGLAHGGALLRVLAYLFSTAITFFFLCIVPQKKSFLSKVGQESLSVYCWHYYVIYALDGFGVIGLLGDGRLRVALPIFVIIALLEVMIFSHKPFTMPVRWMMDGKEKTD